MTTDAEKIECWILALMNDIIVEFYIKASDVARNLKTSYFQSAAFHV